MSERRGGGGGPDAATLLAFLLIVLIGGINFVAVRFSNRELAPFYGAGIRFIISSALLFLYVAIRRVPLPRGKGLTGTLIFGLLSFTGAYAFAYSALQKLPAAAASVIMASVPLLTLFFAMLHRVEKFRIRGLIGGVLALAGIVVIVGGTDRSDIPVGAVLTMLGTAVCAAESSVIIKRFPPSHPVATNAVAMGVGGLLLFPLSLVAREAWIVPQIQTTWVTLAYLVVIGSVGLFGLYLFALGRWTASGVSYMFVLAPIVAAVAGIVLEGASITAGLAIGGAIILAGVYVGALTVHREKEAPAALPEGCAPAVEKSVA